MSRTTITAGLLALILAAAPALARGGEGSGGEGSNLPRSGLNNVTTRAVVLLLSRGFDRCDRLPQIYKFDCFGKTYKRAADKLKSNPSYGEAGQALERVQKTLAGAVAQNLDPAQKPRRQGLNVYRAVKPAAVPQIKRQTQQAMQQAETVLLRSSGAKKVHYARIAEAVNSNKVLLRSAMLPGGTLRLALHLLRLAAPA